MAEVEDMAMAKLLPALGQCLTVILAGYTVGRLSIVTDQETRALSLLVGRACLPCLIFSGLATLDLTSLSWPFLCSLALAKAIIFVSVLILSLLLARPPDPPTAALYAIFTTQSNDFAIGLPIASALFPDLARYLYLVAPVNLVLLNPIGFFLMELGRTEGGPRASAWQLAVTSFLGVLKNPIVAMTGLGIIANFAWSQSPPTAILAILDVFGSAFTACALFLLGLKMVGKIGNLTAAPLLIIAVLVATKELVLPVLMREVSSLLLDWSGANATDVAHLSTFGFLYGTFPTAPGVFVYANTYGLDSDLITSGMVACTFLSAPLMLLSAKMVSTSSGPPQTFYPWLTSFEWYLALASIVAVVWLVVLFIYNQNYRKTLSQITLAILVSQLVGCVGVLLANVGPNWTQHIQYLLVTSCDLSTQLWTACLAVTLVLIESRNFSMARRVLPLMATLGWGLPVLLLIVMSIVVQPQVKLGSLEAFPYSTLEACLTIFIQLASLSVTSGAIVLKQRTRKRVHKYLICVREASAEVDSDPEEQVPKNNGRVGGECRTEVVGDPEGLETDILLHLVLVIFLAFSSFLALAVSLWRVVSETVTGVFVELSFLEQACARGISLVVLLIFGWDTIPALRQVTST